MVNHKVFKAEVSVLFKFYKSNRTNYCYCQYCHLKNLFGTLDIRICTVY